jgi:hypothetical protein
MKSFLRRHRIGVIGAILAPIVLAGIAFAQVGIPTMWLSSPNGQEQVEVTAYAPGAQKVDVALASVRDAAGYQKLTPVTGATIVMGGAVGCSPQAATAGSCVSVLQLTPAGTLSTLAIKTPLYPVDGQKMQIFSTQAVTTLTMSASQSQTLNGGLTSLSANTGGAWIYSAGSANNNGTWDRIQ